MKKTFVLLLLLCTIASCSLLQNRKANIVNKELTLIPKDESQTYNKLPFIIIKADGRLAGSTGCNRILGKAYFGDSGDVIFKEVATTKMLCQSDDDLEQKFLYILNNTLHYQVTSDAVFLLDGNKTPLVKLKIK